MTAVTTTNVTFWSVEDAPSLERYHLGQLSVVRRMDDRVRRGERHLAIICDSDSLKDKALYSRVPEVACAVIALSECDVRMRTLTSYLALASLSDQSRLFELKAKLQEQIIPKISTCKKELCIAWRSGQLSNEQLVAQSAGHSDSLQGLDVVEAAALTCFVSDPPAWSEPYWVVSLLLALKEICAEHTGSVRLVEGVRSSYVWDSLRAIAKLLDVDQTWFPAKWAIEFLHNIKSDGPRRYMCFVEKNHALLMGESGRNIRNFVTKASPAVRASIADGCILPFDQPEALADGVARVLQRIQGRWILGTDTAGGNRLVPPPAQADSVRGVVSVHGVLSRGVWQKKLNWPRDARVEHLGEDLGYLLPTVVLSTKIAVRKARQLAQTCYDLERKRGRAVSILAHSFGTHVVRVVLENFAIELDTIVLSGCIISPDFGWGKFLEAGRVKRVINLLAPKDNVPFLARVAGKEFGASGTEGFTTGAEGLFQPSAPQFSHSDWFAEPLLSRVLLPFLATDQIPPSAAFREYL